MNIRDDYYNSQIESYRKEQAIAALGIEACLSFVKFKNERQKQKIMKKIEKMQAAKISKVTTIKRKITSDLSKLKSSSVYYSEVEKIIESQQNKYGIRLKYNEKSDMSHLISNNSIQALKDYINKYVNAKKMIENLNQQQEQEIKKENERKNKKEQGKSETKSEKNNVSYNGNGPSYISSTKTITQNNSEPFSAPTVEERKKLIKEKIDSMINSGRGYLSYEEEKVIKKLYPELNSYNKYFSVETLVNGIKINRINNKKDIKTNEMMELGLIILEVTTKQLLFDRGINEPDLFNKLGMKNNLEKYKPIYDRYMKWYNSLDSEQKTKVKQEISSKERYRITFGESIATPNQLKNKINEEVIKYIINNAYMYYDKEFYTKTIQVSRYMSIEDITSLYHSIKYKYQKNYEVNSWGDSKEISEQKQKNHDETIEKLQRDFARVILAKLEEYTKNSNNFNNMTAEEKEKYLKEKDKKLAAICLEILNEKPLSADLRKLTANFDFKEKKESLLDTYKAKETAKTRVYGLTKAQKALAQLTGKWAKYSKLMAKEDLTNQEQEELKRMFR